MHGGQRAMAVRGNIKQRRSRVRERREGEATRTLGGRRRRKEDGRHLRSRCVAKVRQRERVLIGISPSSGEVMAVGSDEEYDGLGEAAKFVFD